METGITSRVGISLSYAYDNYRHLIQVTKPDRFLLAKVFSYSLKPLRAIPEIPRGPRTDSEGDIPTEFTLPIPGGREGAIESQRLIRKRNQTNQLQTKLLTSGPGGRRFKSSLPDQFRSTA
jgi:hypothetical protein